jgi:hypothetical protein
MAEIGFKKVSLETNMDPIVFYQVTGLPDGVKWRLSPEDSNRPRGGWYVAAGRKTIHCGSLAEAKEAATKLANQKRVASSGKAGKAAAGSTRRRSRAASR